LIEKKLQDKRITAATTCGGSIHLIPFVFSSALCNYHPLFDAISDVKFFSIQPHFAIKTHKTKIRILRNHTRKKKKKKKKILFINRTQMNEFLFFLVWRIFRFNIFTI